MKIKINGEFTKEELEKKLKEFDKPEWEVKESNGYISLFKNIFYKVSLLSTEQEMKHVNLSTISRDMADAMGDLMETKDVLNFYKTGHYIHLDASDKRWYSVGVSHYTSDKHFKTKETAELAAKLLNESKDMKDWIKRMSE